MLGNNRFRAGMHPLLFVAAGLSLAESGCGPRNAYVPPPPPEVIVSIPEQRSVTIYHKFPGTMQASEMVELRSRVQGYLESIHFQDGSTVAQGDLLFVIDRRPYQAALAEAQAQLASARATAVEDKSLYKRTLALIPYEAATREEAETQRGSWLVAQASILSAEAKVREAELNLGYTEIRAPISGRMGRHLVDLGSLIAANSTILATIRRYNPMYAYFNATQAQYLDFLKRQRRHPSGTLEATLPPSPAVTAAAMAGAEALPEGLWAAIGTLLVLQPHYPIELGLPNETGYPHRGFIDFANNTINPNTGTLLLRGFFANPLPYYLAPGMFVRLRVPVRTVAHALLVPESALGTDQAGQYLLVVRPDNIVERRGVRTGARIDNRRVIEEGIQSGERFIVEGLQHARPGTKVKPKEAGNREEGTGSREE